jgi:hypothetical protein
MSDHSDPPAPTGDRLDAVARYLASGDEEGLPPGERHELDRVRRLLAGEAMWASPPPELAEVVVAQIAASPSPASPSGTSPSGTRLSRISPPRTRPSRISPRRAVLAGLSAAAVLVVVLVLAQRDPAGDGARQVALAGSELAPGARATADVRDTPTGVAITLRVEGLPPAPAGSYYQAWVTGPAGPVAIGTFHLRDGDHEPIELWSGVDLDGYPTITVTLEPEDGNPASSGRRVLAGTLPGP